MDLHASRTHFSLSHILDAEEKAEEWLMWDQNEETSLEISNLLRSPNTFERSEELKDLMLRRLEFGTAGLRGRMGAGYSRMNDLVIIQTSQGLAAYLEEVHPQSERGRGIAVGFDGRHNSRRFAELTAGVFARRGFRVFLFSEICPTPFISFCVNFKSCLAGVMVTASHNPKQDNGYKVYWESGTQIVPPHDKSIQDQILANLEPWEDVWETGILQNNKAIEDPLAEVSSAYYGVLKENMLNHTVNANMRLNITYTAMHGVGYRYMAEAFNIASFKPFITVVQQRDPHPDFPTVEFPNPEEGKSALNLSIQTADESDSPLILANDPDADRLAVAERAWVDNGKIWRIFTGNELGALLGWWSFYSYRQRFPDVPLKNLYMLGSTVSTKFLHTMSQIEGFNYVETLTGFKWMGNEARKLLHRRKAVLFAFEEAIGFMCGTAVLDKDGISAGVHVAEMVAHLAQQNVSLADKLVELYDRYGYHLSMNSYFKCYEPSKIDALFTRLREFAGKSRSYPKSVAKGKYLISSVRDLTTGYDSSELDEEAILPTSSSSQMITFRFSNGVVATLRTSGTEPKVKYYTELVAPPGKREVKLLQAMLEDMVQAIVHDFIQPEVYGFEPRDA